MGMFDYFKVEYPLPENGYEGRTFQTKDTPTQMCDKYKVDAAGQLWLEEYDIVDYSTDSMDPLDALLSGHTENHRWVMSDFTGQVDFYTFKDESPARGWIEFRAQFIDGLITEVSTLKNKDSLTERS